MSKNRREDLKLYQRRRAELRRARGIVSRTIWIREADEGRFREQVEALVDHARLIEAVTGGPELPATDIAEIIKRHNLPYDPSDLVFLSHVQESVVLDPSGRNAIERRAQEIINRYHFAVSIVDLLE